MYLQEEQKNTTPSSSLFPTSAEIRARLAATQFSVPSSVPISDSIFDSDSISSSDSLSDSFPYRSKAGLPPPAPKEDKDKGRINNDENLQESSSLIQTPSRSSSPSPSEEHALGTQKDLEDSTQKSSLSYSTNGNKPKISEGPNLTNQALRSGEGPDFVRKLTTRNTNEAGPVPGEGGNFELGSAGIFEPTDIFNSTATSDPSSPSDLSFLFEEHSPSPSPSPSPDSPISPIDELINLISKYVYDPVAFVREQLGVKVVDKKQRESLESLLSDHFVAVRSGNGVGKTAMLAWAAIWFLVTRFRCKVPCTAVNSKQMNSNLWPEIAYWISQSQFLSRILDCRNEYVRVKGYRGWEIIPRAAVNSKGQINVGLQGIHAPYILYIIDECSGVPDAAIDSLESSGTNKNTYGLAASNPTRRNGFFFHLFHKNRGSWKNIHVRPGESSQVGEDFYLRMERKYGGKQTNGYQIRVEGNFPSAEDTGLIAWDDYQNAIVTGISSDIFYSEPGPTRMSIDPAGSGPEADASTFGIRRGKYIWKMESFHGLDNPGLVAKAKDFIEEYGVEEVVVDKIGLGRGLHEDLESIYSDQIDDGAIRIHGVNVGTSAYENAEFFNLRAEIYHNSTQAIKKGRIFLCEDWPFLEMDLTDIQKKYTLTRKLQIERKDEFRERNDGRSTDYGDTFALLFFDEHAEEDTLQPADQMQGLLVLNRELKRSGVFAQGELSGMYSQGVGLSSGMLGRIGRIQNLGGDSAGSSSAVE